MDPYLIQTVVDGSSLTVLAPYVIVLLSVGACILLGLYVFILTDVAVSTVIIQDPWICKFRPCSLHCFCDVISSYLIMNFQNKHESDLKLHTRLPDMAFDFVFLCQIRKENYSHECIVVGISMSVY